MALAKLGLIDEYEFVVRPRLTGHGPTLFTGLSNQRFGFHEVGRPSVCPGRIAVPCLVMELDDS
jgi:hypothetical protein